MKNIKLKIKNSGFVILFAVTLAAILLSIALGVSNVALKEIKFGTSAKDTNEAFFAADTGAECALVNDKSTGSAFTGSGTAINCNSINIPVNLVETSLWKFIVPALNNGGQGCAIVTVDKRPLTPPSTFTTIIISKGHNNNNQGDCTSSSNTVERQLEVSY